MRKIMKKVFVFLLTAVIFMGYCGMILLVQ